MGEATHAASPLQGQLLFAQVKGEAKTLLSKSAMKAEIIFPFTNSTETDKSAVVFTAAVCLECVVDYPRQNDVSGGGGRPDYLSFRERFRTARERFVQHSSEWAEIFMSRIYPPRKVLFTRQKLVCAQAGSANEP